MSITVAFLLLSTLVGVTELPKTAVFRFQTIGVDSITGQVATTIFRSELSATGKFDVSRPEEIKTALGEDRVISDISDARNTAFQMKVSKAIIGSLSKLAEQIIVNVTLIDVTEDKVEFEDRLGTTLKEDLDIILKRLAKGVALKKKSEVTAELGMITEKETEEMRRRQSWWGTGFRMGGFFPVGKTLGASGMMLGFGAIAMYETPDFFAELDWRYYWDIDYESYYGGAAYFMPITISLFKVFSKTDVAPYAGGGLGFSFVTGYELTGWQFRTESSNGFVINAGGGIMFFRTYDFRIVLDGRYYISIAQAGGSDIQHGPTISIGLLYRRSKTERGCCCIGF